jgi:hypothetical protein
LKSLILFVALGSFAGFNATDKNLKCDSRVAGFGDRQRLAVEASDFQMSDRAAVKFRYTMATSPGHS